MEKKHEEARTMKAKAIKSIGLALIFAFVLAGAAQQSAEQLYKTGLYEEEMGGDLQKAIGIYQDILKRFPDNRSIAAMAQLHIGLCYDKLGTSEAEKAFQNVIDNYPEQKNEVTIAREMLSRLISAAGKGPVIPPGPKFTKIRIPTKLSWSVKLSPDGKDLALISDEKIWIMPLSGNIGPDFPGKPVPLNTEGILVEWSGLAWSGDGKWIAFNDPGMPPDRLDQVIYIVPSSGGKPKKIVENFRDARVVNYRISLSPDGKTLAHSSVENKEQHIFTTLVEGGSPKRLVDMQAREPAFSPDGKMIAFVEDKDLGRGEGKLGLWVVPAQGGTPHLVADAGKASSPVWSPDGRMIAFLDSAKNKPINFVEIPKDWQTPGKVTSIEAPKGISEVTLLAGWTPDNKIGVLLTAKQEFALYTLPATGGQAAIILPDCYALQPRWSRDGKQIFYVTFPTEPGENRFYKGFLASVPATGGAGKPLIKGPGGMDIRQLPFQSGNRISPDGKTLLSSAWTPADTGGVAEWPNSKIWKIGLDRTESKQITHEQGRVADMCPSWSPDGEKIAFLRVSLTDDPILFSKMSLNMISSSGGELKALISESDKLILSPVWSPDGKMIAYLTRDKKASGETPMARILNVIDVASGAVRVVGEVPDANVNMELAWSPDSRRIAFNGDKVIKVMKVDDGKIEEIQTNLVDVIIWHLDWSPDGGQFVFSGGTDPKAEFWFLENFLPADKAKK
jgi:Tol biopolymer transport system component